MTKPHIYETGLGKTPANFEALTPLSFLARAARVYPDYPALIHGPLRQSWAQTERRCRQLASALRRRGIGEGDTVSIVAPNVPAMFEAHFGVPMSGAVLNTINTRLDAQSMAFIFQHAQSRVVLVDREFGAVVRKALSLIDSQPLVIAIDDPLYREGELVGELTYETFIAGGNGDEPGWLPADEWQAISLNYTSGTTGNPKGVVHSHLSVYAAVKGNIDEMKYGEADVLARVRPLLQCLGQRIVHIGPNGAGQVAKACNQMIMVNAIQASAEAMRLAGAHGLDLGLRQGLLDRLERHRQRDGLLASPHLGLGFFAGELVEDPHRPANRLRGLEGCYKIKLRAAGVRLVYKVEDGELVILVVAVGKRDKNAVYDTARERLVTIDK